MPATSRPLIEMPRGEENEEEGDAERYVLPSCGESTEGV